MLPARDAAETLEEAAVSCLEQSWEDFELLLLENDSTRETRGVMRALAERDRRVRVIEGEPGAGFIAALNRGWREARGRFLARMDADDRCRPNRLERQLTYLDAHPDVAACGSRVRILRRRSDGSTSTPARGYARFERWLNSLETPEDLARERFVDSPVANPAALVRREIMEELGGYREVSWAEDYDFWLRLLDARHRLANVPEVLLEWMDSEHRLTRRDSHYSEDAFLLAKAHYLARLEPVRERNVVLCGAGPIGKRLARYLGREGVPVRAFLDVHPRRIGNEIEGIPVRGGDWLGQAENRPVIVSAVGQPGGRERVRKWLQPFGVREGETFFCAA